MHFKIIIPAYNVENYIIDTIDSVEKQTHKDYEVVIINDCSKDKTLFLIEERIKDNIKFNIINNTERMYALYNINNGIEYLKPKDDDIIVLLDGDDRFYLENALQIVNEAYKEQPNLMMTYGSTINMSNGKQDTNAGTIDSNVIENNSHRTSPWICVSHLRTFKSKVYKLIDKNDFKDKDGNYYKMTYDFAILIPILEMIGPNVKKIFEPLYHYNDLNPINDYKVDPVLQRNIEDEIRQKKKYKRVF